MADLTDEQLDILNKDIESGLVMIVNRKHYYELEKRIKELEDYLIEFGVHKFECVANTTWSEKDCNCGLAKALKG